MILRRVIAHFKKQEWTAIALDFLIVVVGVFVGLQVNNWNAAQADQRRGGVYVQRLIDDLQVDLDYRRALLSYYAAVKASADITVELMTSPAPDPKALIVNAFRSTEFAYNPQTRATWDEIVSSGDLSLIPREALDAGLSLYFGVDVAQQTMDWVQRSPYRYRVRRTIPHAIQVSIRANCSDVRNDEGSVIGFANGCTFDVPEEELAAAAQLLASDPELLMDLNYHFSTLNSGLANLRGDTVQLENAIRVLGGDPGAAPDVREEAP
ncbi:hypothetical protein [Hyphococcus sp.]|uniref:hypothetical protein n=1 Tax=Hyphococcus sp. TaxID=2038636 RepID=UPI00207FDAFC|nr:MAG: hypothetical protein DHS20C04_24150 [Marinicaulis sp.]